MQSVWGPDEVICIHPGAVPLIGFDRVMQSWQQIFGGGQSVPIRPELLHSCANDSLAVHVVREVLAAPDGEAVVLATNVYRRFSEGWKMIEHHASQPRRETLGAMSGPHHGVTLQ